ncbi:MAG: c-type cytochrome [Campylobacterota bacterium]|nr:c-type cytochrome [Campylobacterota bacterium]
MLLKKSLSLFAVAGLLSVVYASDKVRSPQVIFTKKCAMCHTIDRPTNKAQKKRMVAPPIKMAMSGVVITIDAVEGPMSDSELREESIDFLKDYLYNPHRDKTNCEDFVVKKFGMMPSLKGFISQKELDVVVPWVYDKFKPSKVDGKYQDQHKK